MSELSSVIHGEQAVERLIALARNAQCNVDLDDPVDYWYRLGQRNAYVEAAGLILAGGVDDDLAFKVADRITGALFSGGIEVAELRGRAEAALQVRLAHARNGGPLEWIGPAAFAKRWEAIGSQEEEVGRLAGENGDRRVRLRLDGGAGEGLLYVYDATWDEYAVIAEGVALEDARAALTQGQDRDGHLDLSRLAAVVRTSATRPPSIGPEL